MTKSGTSYVGNTVMLFDFYNTKTVNFPFIRVKTVIVNPTKYFVRPYLTRYNYKDNTEEHEEFSGNAREENRTVVDGFNVLKDDAEFDQGELDLIKYRGKKFELNSF